MLCALVTRLHEDGAPGVTREYRHAGENLGETPRVHFIFGVEGPMLKQFVAIVALLIGATALDADYTCKSTKVCPLLTPTRTPVSVPTPPPYTGEIFYITPTGKDSNDGKTVATAWASPHLHGTFNGGDTIIVKSGDYIAQWFPGYGISVDGVTKPFTNPLNN